jgi:hypothetical protein
VLGDGWRLEQALHDSEDSVKLNTSFVVRLNLTIRQGSAYLSRRTICHARWKKQLEDHLELLRCYYNFVRPHRAVKFGREVRTPAMQAGLTRRRLTLREIFSSKLLVVAAKDVPICAVRNGSVGQFPESGSASGGLATIDDGSTDDEPAWKFCADMSRPLALNVRNF